MATDLVLITGATGHVGFRVLVFVLNAGYSVRAAVRNESKSDIILSTASIQAISPGPRLTFVTVPNILADGAYDDAVKGVKYIIHVASPLPKQNSSQEDFELEIIAPAVKGTVGMLESANKTTGIERIVITGSNASIMPTPILLFGGSDEIYDENSVAEPTPLPIENPFVAYCSSKISAWLASEEFITTKELKYDVVTIMPSFVIGKNELVTNSDEIATGSNGFVIAQVLGISIGMKAGSTTVHLDDVAKAHVLALDPKIPGNTNYLLCSGGITGNTWSDALKIVAESFPLAVSDGTLPNNGTMETNRLKVDSSKVEKIFGFKLLEFSEQVKSVVGHYLELLGKPLE